MVDFVVPADHTLNMKKKCDKYLDLVGNGDIYFYWRAWKDIQRNGMGTGRV